MNEQKWLMGGFVRLLEPYGSHKEGVVTRICPKMDSTGKLDIPYREGGTHVSVELKWNGSLYESCNIAKDKLEWIGMRLPEHVNNNYSIY